MHGVPGCPGLFSISKDPIKIWQLESVGTHGFQKFLRVSFNFLTHISKNFVTFIFFHEFLGLLRDGHICCWGGFYECQLVG